MSVDIENLLTVISYRGDRIERGNVLKAKDKIMSNSDKDAAFIKKGQREAVIGYKPQLSGSRNGFITSIDVPEGNAADSRKLEPMVDQHIARTQIVPKIVNADDGYASAKGKSEVESKARNKRSSVESLMFTYKARPQLWSGNEAWYRLCPGGISGEGVGVQFLSPDRIKKAEKGATKTKTRLESSRFRRLNLIDCHLKGSK